MKAGAVRALAERYDVAALGAAAEAIAEGGADPEWVEGGDPGEKLTHVMLALRVRARMDSGEALKDAFRAEMAGVREVMTNEAE